MIIFLYGADTYRSRLKLKEIIDRYKSQHKSGLNFNCLYASEVKDFSEFKKHIESLSMFNEKRFLVVENVFQSNWIEKWIDYLYSRPNLAQSNDEIVLFYENNDIDDGKGKSLQEFLTQKPVMYEEFKLLDRASLTRWVMKEVQQRKISLNREIMQKLIINIGNDLWQMSNELDKLAMVAKGSSGSISVEEIDLLLNVNFSVDIFKTIDALAERDKAKAINFLYQHLSKGEHELRLLSMIAYQLRNLIKIKELEEKGIPYYQMKKKAKMHPFVFQKTVYQAKKFSFDELKKLYARLGEFDIGIKTGRIEARTALDSLVFEF